MFVSHLMRREGVRILHQQALDDFSPSLELASKARLNLRSVNFHVPSKIIIINSDLSTEIFGSFLTLAKSMGLTAEC